MSHIRSSLSLKKPRCRDNGKTPRILYMPCNTDSLFIISQSPVQFNCLKNNLGNTAQSACGISWKICALISSLFLEVHKVHLRKSAFIRTQIFSGSALAELCGVALELPQKSESRERISTPVLRHRLGMPGWAEQIPVPSRKPERKLFAALHSLPQFFSPAFPPACLISGNASHSHPAKSFSQPVARIGRIW